jgi:polyisoprenoid-binding protein YceI
MKKFFVSLFILIALTIALPKAASAEEYVIDTTKAHAFIQFKISHLGYSWIYGRLNTFEGSFSFDEKMAKDSQTEISIDTASVDTNFAERDKHLRSDDFLDVKKFPKATFKSTSYEPKGKGKGTLKGEFTLHGVTHPIEIEVSEIGTGKDPWGGYRRGFEGSFKFALADYGILKELGPSSKVIEIFLSIEGIRK